MYMDFLYCVKYADKVITFSKIKCLNNKYNTQTTKTTTIHNMIIFYALKALKKFYNIGFYIKRYY